MRQAYTDAASPWLGRIPEDWVESRFRYEAFISSGQVDPRMEPWSDMVLVAPNHIESGTGRLLGRETAADQGADSGKYVVTAGQVLYSKIRPALNKVALAVEDCLCSADMYAISLSDRADTRFARYFMSAKPFHDFATAMSMRVKMPKVNREELADGPWLLPPVPEQRAIADFLDRETARIDTLVEEQQRLIEMLRERRVAAIATGFDAVCGRMTRLKYFSTVQTGITLSGEGNPADAEWQYLRVANVQVGFVDLREIKTVRVPPGRAAASMLQNGDVLMTEGGDIDKLGRGALWRGELPNMLHQNHIFAVRPSEELDSEFLVYWLDGPVARTYFRTTAKQTTNLAGTNKWTLGNLPLPLPPIEDQRRAVADLDEQTSKIDSLILETERFIEFARERRSALITAAVTGQIDVREAA